MTVLIWFYSESFGFFVGLLQDWCFVIYIYIYIYTHIYIYIYIHIYIIYIYILYIYSEMSLQGDREECITQGNGGKKVLYKKSKKPSH